MGAIHLTPMANGIRKVYIRQVWLYGIDGVLPKDRDELQEMTKCSTQQLDLYMTWLWQEREDMYKEAIKDSYVKEELTLAKGEHLQQYRVMVDVLKQQLDDTEFEMSLYEVGSKQHSAMLKQWLQLKKEWAQDTGVAAMHEVFTKIMQKQQMAIADDNQRKLDEATQPRVVGGDGAKALGDRSVFDK